MVILTLLQKCQLVDRHLPQLLLTNPSYASWMVLLAVLMTAANQLNSHHA